VKGAEPYLAISQVIDTSRRPLTTLQLSQQGREVGLHVRHGRLNGLWRDVLLVELLLGEAQPA
jgi:hypothetical protein